MPPSLDPHLLALLGIVALSLTGVLLAIVRLVRSGRSVEFPSIEVRPPAPTRSAHENHASIR